METLYRRDVTVVRKSTLRVPDVVLCATLKRPRPTAADGFHVRLLGQEG